MEKSKKIYNEAYKKAEEKYISELPYGLLPINDVDTMQQLAMDSFYMGVKFGIESDVSEIKVLLDEFHNDLAKSVQDFKLYHPLSVNLHKIKDLIKKLNP